MYRQVLKIPHFEPSLNALSLRSDVTSSIKILYVETVYGLQCTVYGLRFTFHGLRFADYAGSVLTWSTNSALGASRDDDIMNLLCALRFRP